MRFTLLLILIPTFIWSQSKYDYNWPLGYFSNVNDSTSFFGNVVTFSESSVGVKELNLGIRLNQYLGCISDKEGELLFYTNGCQVVDADGVLLENGDSINVNSDFWEWDCVDGFVSYTGPQEVIVLPSLTEDDEYKILHRSIDFLYENTDTFTAHVRTLSETTIVNTSNSLHVINKNIPVMTEVSMVDRNFKAVMNDSRNGWWLLMHKMNTNTTWITSYDEEGVTVRDSVDLGPVLTSQDAGGSAFSADGSLYMIYEHFHGLCLFDFDRSTGRISNYRNYQLDVPNVYDDFPFQFTSCIFSPSGQFAYVIYQGHIYQLDLWADDIEASTVLVGEYDGLVSGGGRANFYQGILGPDCNIYICTADASDIIHTIHSPDRKGIDCDFRQHDIRLPYNNGQYTIPNFPHFRIDEDQLCDPTITSVFGLPVEVVYKPRLSPNPTADITISNYLLQQYQIYDVAGQLHRQYSGSKATEEIDLTGLPSGLYIVKMQKEDGTWWTEKVIRL